MAIQVALKNNAKESATILDDFVLKRYNNSIQKYGPSLKECLGKFGQSDMQLTGSSPLMLVYLLNLGLLPKDARLATRKDLEIALSRANGFLSGVYVDCGLNLVTGKNNDYKINSILAKSLVGDLENVGIKLKNAKLIPYNILTCKIDEESPNGLVFKLSKEGKDTAKELVLNTSDFKWNYLPNDSGLFRAFLYWNGCWGARYEFLVDSGADSRVVVVSGEATSQKFLERYAHRLKEKRDKTIAEARKKYTKIKASLKVE